MEQYRVLTLSISGKGRKIYRLGDKVTQSQLHVGIDELLASGAIITEADWVSRETRIAEEEKVRQANPVAFMPGYPPFQNHTGVSNAGVPAMTTPTPTADTKPEDKTGGEGAGGSKEPKSIEGYTKAEIQEELDTLEVDYKSSESKESLYNLLVKAKSLNA